MMEALHLKNSDIVLEIGTGSGYQTALLAEIVKKVYTIERIAQLSNQARNRLSAMNYNNIEFYIGDGTTGWPDNTIFFDKVIVTAGAPIIPESLVKQMKTGGRMIIPVGDKSTQTMKLVVKKTLGYDEYELGGFAFVPLIGKEGWHQ
jgi:protein-L-isoaspartate(D-aspartate) O-methyltransferase